MITFISEMEHDRLMFSLIFNALPASLQCTHTHNFIPLTALDHTDIIVVWNGMGGLSARCVAIAQQLGRPRVCWVEHGYLSKTIQMDSLGVNAGSSITDTITGEMLMNMPIDQKMMNVMQEESLVQRQFYDGITIRTDDTDDSQPLPEHYALFVCQVYDDSNLVAFGDGWTNEKAIEDIAANLEAGNTLVVKEHPSDYGRIDYRWLREKVFNLHWRRTTPVADLIAGAKIVWTINSSVAIEAMRQGKRVEVLGRAAFRNIANEYSGRQQDIVDRYLYWLRWHYLLHTNPFHLDKTGTQGAAQRIIDILEDKKPWLDCFH